MKNKNERLQKMRDFYDENKNILTYQRVRYSNDIEKEYITTVKKKKLSGYDMYNYGAGLRKYKKVFCPQCMSTSKVIKSVHDLELRKCTKNDHIFFTLDTRSLK